MYEAAARVEVDKEAQTMQPFADSNSFGEYEDSENYIETQTKILQSETLALMTIKSMDLGRYPEFGGNPNAIAGQHSGGISRRPAILGAFLGRLGVSRVPNSRLIQVQFEAEDPQLAAQVVNAHLQNFVEQNFRSKYDATIQASNWLSAELEELRIKVENSENARIAYERENKIWQIDEKQDITTQKLADLSRVATDAQTDVAQKEALYRMAISGDIDALPAARTNEVISSLVRRKSELAQQYADAVDQYGPNFPKVLRIAAQQKELEENLASARKTMVQSIEEEYETSKSHADLLQEALDKQKDEANELAEKLVQYHILQHDAESNKQLYDGLLQKLKEAGITAGLRSSNIRVVDPALAPSTPSRPQKSHNILLAILVGLVGGVGLALFREYLDNTVKSPDDIEALTGLPSLAVVPALPAQNAKSRPPFTVSTRRCAAIRIRPARRTVVLHSAKVPNFRSIPRVAYFAVAVASGPSTASDSGNQRVATRRKNYGCGESCCYSGATGRSDSVDGFRPAQAGHTSRAEHDYRQGSGSQLVPGRRLYSG